MIVYSNRALVTEKKIFFWSFSLSKPKSFNVSVRRER